MNIVSPRKNNMISMNDFRETVQNKLNDELLKMVYGFDEWSPEMLKAVEDELSKRNIYPMI
jgi:hypothetical protein